MVTIERMSNEEFDKLPAQSTKKPSQWDSVLDGVASGEVMLIKGDEKVQRGARIALGRLAKQRTLTLEYRRSPEGVAVRQSQAATTDETPKPSRGRRGRRPARGTEA